MQKHAGNSFQDSSADEQRFRLATSGARIGVWDWDLASDRVFYSAEWMQIRGCNEGEIKGVPDDCFGRVHPDDLDDLRAGRAKLIDGSVDHSASEHRVRHGNGSWVWILQRAHAVRDKQGKTQRLVGCDVEITARKERELQLERKQQRYQAIAEAVPVAILQCDQNHCLYASEYWSEFTGRPAESALGHGWTEAIHPDDLQNFHRFRTKYELGPPNQELVRDGIKGRLLKPDGTVNWFSSRVRLTYSSDGKLESFTITLIDTTEQQQLLQHQERLTAILETTTDYVGIATPQFKSVWYNKHLLEIRPDESQPRDYHPDWAWRILTEIGFPTAIENGNWSGETAVLDVDGNEIPVSQVLIAHKGSDGNVEAFSTIMRSIADVKAAESALRISEQKFSNLARASPVGIFQLDASLNHLYANERWSEMTGLTPGQDITTAIHPDDLPEVLEHIDAFVADKTRVVSEPIEPRHVMPNGSTKWIQGQMCKEIDEEGNVVGYVGALSDVTAIKQAEKELRKISESLNRVLRSASVGVWEWNPVTDELAWDEVMMQIHGVEATSFSGTGEEWRKRIHPDDFERLFQIEYPKLMNTGHSGTEFRILRDDGEVRYIFSDQFVEKNENDEAVKVSGINTDVTERNKTERALRESESKFQRVAEHVPGMVFRYIVHPDGTDELTYVSSQVREIFEMETEAAIKDVSNVWGRIHEDDSDLLHNAVAASVKDLKPLLIEYRLKLPEKGTRWVQTLARPMRSENGDVILDGLVVDHTDRKRAEMALQESQTQFHRMTENVPGMLFRYVLHPDSSHEVLYASSRVEDFFGFPAESATQNIELFMQRIHPDDLPGYQRAIEVSAETLGEFKQECRLIFDDRILWAETTSRPERLANGDIVWDGLTIDITHRKETELALKESRTQFERMTENVPGMIFRYVMHPDGTNHVPYVSSQCRDLFEVERQAVLETPNQLFNFIHPDDRELLDAALRRSSETLTPVNVDFRVILPEQGLRWRQMIGQPARIADGPTVFDGVVLDMTHAKATELQLRYVNDELATATKMKDQFLANMSHEFRTPLNAILGMTEGLKNGVYGSINSKQQASLDIVEQSSLHLLELVNGILDLARIESGLIELNLSDFDLKSLCESSLRLVTPQAEQKKLQLNLNVPWNLPKLLADEQRIRQVLINLLINAVKFTQADGVVTLEVDRLPRSETQSEDVLRISVIDTGIGIEPEQLESVFHPFVQVDSTLSRQHDGTGLGLSLVKQFVELHGGHVTVTSEPGIGSCFSVDLPYRQSSAAAGDSDHPATKTTSELRCDPKDKAISRNHLKANGKLPSILLAEDNDSVAAAVTWYLEDTGYEILRATDGRIAIDLAQQCTPDLILMDIQMPNVDGFAAIKRIRETPGISKTPIIAITGLAMHEDSERCIAAGADDYLRKPYRVEELIKHIEKLLGKNAPNNV